MPNDVTQNAAPTAADLAALQAAIAQAKPDNSALSQVVQQPSAQPAVESEGATVYANPANDPEQAALYSAVQAPSAQPKLAPPRRSSLPGVVGLITNLIKPPMVAQPGELARPVSRVSELESFLTNFLGAMGAGFANAGTGPGSFGRGFGAAMSYPMMRQAQQQQLEEQQAQIAEQQARASLTQKQADLAGQTATINTQYGPITLPISALSNYLKGGFSAQVNAQSRMNVEELKAQIQSGQVAKVLPGKDASGNLVMNGYDKQGRLLGVVEGALPPSSYLPTTSSTTQYMQDGNGNIVALPKSTTTSKIPPALAQRVPALANPSGPAANNPQAPRSGFPRPAGAITARPVTGPDGQPLSGKSGGDSVYGIDPQSGQTMLSDRVSAAARGLQGIRKVSDSTIRADMHDTRVLNDISVKANNVIDSAAALDQNMQQKAIIANALEASDKDNQFRLGISHTNLPLSAFNQLMSAHGFLGSEAATQLSRDYIVNVLSLREAAMGLQKVLTGSARSNETQLSALLNTLPGLEPDPALARQKLAAFTQNIQMLREGIPTNLGIQVVPLKQIPAPQSQQQQQPQGQAHAVPSTQFSQMFFR